jgi:hypothetical protein
MATSKWIRLNEGTAKLKVGVIEGETYLFITGLPRTSPLWQRSIDRLGFGAASRYLVRRVAPHERITVRDYQQVFPTAGMALMDAADFRLDFGSGGKESSSESRERERREALREVQAYALLGRNHLGDRVYGDIGGRVILRESDWSRTRERAGTSSAEFLRIANDADADLCAEGVVASILKGEPQRSDNMKVLYEALGLDTAEKQLDFRARIDAAMLRHLRQVHATPDGAYLDSRDLYEGIVPWQAGRLGDGAMPLPLSILVQRYLGDLQGKSLLVTSAYDAATFFYLTGAERILAHPGAKDLSALAATIVGDAVQWAALEFDRVPEGEQFDAVIHNADRTRDGRLDVVRAAASLEALPAGGRAVFLMPGGSLGAEEAEFYEQLGRRYRIIDAYALDARMTAGVGSDKGLRVVYLSHEVPDAASAPADWRALPVVHGWDEIKTRVEEAIHRAGVVGMEEDGLAVDQRVRQENRLQRPYMAFSKVGEAIAMAPSDLQEGLQAALSRVESLHGPVDEFVMRELGYGEQTLAENFAPEQVDALAVSLDRMMRGSAVILADDTGMGKGRTIAGHMAWAERRGINVIFMTDRASLFSDIFRDLDDINESGRFRPLIVNRDVVIEDLIGDKGVWAESDPPQYLESIIEAGSRLEDVGRNLVLCTYSQISTEDSAKAQWLKEQIGNSLLILDEAHLAAGNDSNRAAHMTEMVTGARAVLYSSATWAKTEKNLALYARAFPSSINRATLARSMGKGGENFSTMFSAMLAHDGALIRREHDVSRTEFRFSDPARYRERNVRHADAVSGVMGQIAYLARDINRLTRAAEEDLLRVLREAREARAAATGSILRSTFGSGSMLYQVMRRLMTALAVDQACDEALEAAQEGRKPVLVFDDTAEATLNRLLPQAQLDEQGNRIVPVPTVADLLDQALERLLTVRKQIVTEQDVEDVEAELAAAAAQEEAEARGETAEGAAPQAQAEGDETRGAETTAEEHVTAQAALSEEPGGRRRRARPRERAVSLLEEMAADPERAEDLRSLIDGVNKIREGIRQLPEIPINVPDMIAERMQAHDLRVGEISGRKNRVVATGTRDAQGRKLGMMVARKGLKRHTNRVVRQFNAGELDVIVLNRSGATGLSLHASERFEDRRQRHLFELQAPSNPTERLQLLGRVQRRGEVVPPVVSFMSCGIHGEMRQQMLNNRALRGLSANVRSSGDSFVANQSVPDLLTPLGAEVIRSYLLDNPGIASRLMIDSKYLKDEGSAVGLSDQFTSRLALLTNREQEIIYDGIDALYKEVLDSNPEKASSIEFLDNKVSEVAHSRQMLFGPDEHINQNLLSAFDGRVETMQIRWEEVHVPPKWDEVLDMVLASRKRLLEAGLAVKADVSSQARAPRGPIYVPEEAIAFGPAQAKGDEEGYDPGDEAPSEQDEAEASEALAPREGVDASAFPFDPTSAWVLGAELPALQMQSEHAQVLKGHKPLKIYDAEIARERRIMAPVQGVELSPLAGDLDAIFHGLSIMALRAMEGLESIEAALISEGDNPVKRAVSRRRWVAEFLHRAVPGAYLEMRVDEERGVLRTGLILDVVVPEAKERRGQLASWGIKALMSDSRKVESIPMSRLAATRATVLYDVFDGRDRRGISIEMMRNLREIRRTRSAAVLVGNLYAAEEWALATGIGRPVLYTDIWGDRHRAVMMRPEMNNEDVLSRLPARAWDEGAIGDIFCSVAAQTDRLGFMAHSSYAGAMKDVDKVKFGRVRIAAKGKVEYDSAGDACHVFLGVGSKDRIGKHKVRRLLEVERKALEAKDPEGPASRIRVSALRKSDGVMVLAQDHDESTIRTIVQIISKGVGLELYARNGTWEHDEIVRAQQARYQQHASDRAAFAIEPVQPAHEQQDRPGVPRMAA